MRSLPDVLTIPRDVLEAQDWFKVLLEVASASAADDGWTYVADTGVADGLASCGLVLAEVEELRPARTVEGEYVDPEVCMIYALAEDGFRLLEEFGYKQKESGPDA